jgi:uncharacterized protein YidB (DUF937 family)
MHFGVLGTFVAAGAAGFGADLDGGTQDFDVGPGAAGTHGPGGGTNVRAVKVQSNALSKFLDHFLTEAGVGAAGTSLGTGVALLDAFQQGVCGAALHMWVGADHLANVHL